jgi:hypothetical protein
VKRRQANAQAIKHGVFVLWFFGEAISVEAWKKEGM